MRLMAVLLCSCALAASGAGPKSDHPRIDGPLDLVFLDAVQSDNLRYYRMVLPKMRRGGAIVVHNVKSHPQNMADFLAHIQSDPAVRTEIVAPGWQGFSVSYVK